MGHPRCKGFCYVCCLDVFDSCFKIKKKKKGDITYSDIGGLGEQIRELRETIELPLTNPGLFIRVGIKPPKGVLLYGPPGTGKTLMARAMANQVEASFLKVVASAIVDKYIGESSRIIREMFGKKKKMACVYVCVCMCSFRTGK